MTPLLGEALFAGGLHLLGISAAGIFWSKPQRLFVYLSGILFGAAVWLLLGLAAIALPGPHLGYLVAMAALTSAGCLYFQIRSGRTPVAALAPTALSVVLCGVATMLIASLMSFHAITYDSVLQTMSGQSMILDPQARMMKSLSAQWGPFIPLLLSPAIWCGLDYLPSIIPTVSLSFLLTFAWLLHEALRGNAMPRGRRLLYVALVLAWLASTPALLYHVHYVHSNWASSMYMFLLILSLQRLAGEEGRPWAFVAAMSFLSLVFLRLENGVFAALIVYQALCFTQDLKRVFAITAAVATVTSAWHLALCTVWYDMWRSSPYFLTPQKSLFLCGLLWSTALLALLFLRFERLRGLRRQFPYVAVCALAAFLAFAFLTKPGHMQVSTRHALIDAVSIWGPLGFGLFSLYLLTAMCRPTRTGRYIEAVVLCMFLVILDVVYFRVIYFDNFHSSVCRLLLLFWPVCLYHVLTEWSRPQAPEEADTTALAARSRAAWIGAACLGGIAIFAIPGMQKTNLAYRAIPVFTSGLESPANAVDNDPLTVSTLRSPAMTVWDMGREVSPRAAMLAHNISTYDHVHLQELFPNVAVDYAVDGSLDQANWTPLFDTRGTGRALARSPWQTVIPLPEGTRLRFLRLRYRAAKDKAPVYVSELALWSHQPPSLLGERRYPAPPAASLPAGLAQALVVNLTPGTPPTQPAVYDAGPHSLPLQENGVTLAADFGGNVLFFPGRGEHLAWPLSPLAEELTRSLTVSVWLKPELDMRATIVDAGFGGCFSLTRESNGAISFNCGRGIDSMGNHAGLTAPPGSAPAGQWTHVTAVRNLQDKALSLYINGRPAASAPYPFDQVVPSKPVVTVGDGYYGPYTGAMHRMAIWSRALTVPEVNAFYAAAAAGDNPLTPGD